MRTTFEIDPPFAPPRTDVTVIFHVPEVKADDVQVAVPAFTEQRPDFSTFPFDAVTV